MPCLTLPLIENAEACFQDYIDAGCNLSVHVEAVKHFNCSEPAAKEERLSVLFSTATR